MTMRPNLIPLPGWARARGIKCLFLIFAWNFQSVGAQDVGWDDQRESQRDAHRRVGANNHSPLLRSLPAYILLHPAASVGVRLSAESHLTGTQATLLVGFPGEGKSSRVVQSGWASHC